MKQGFASISTTADKKAAARISGKFPVGWLALGLALLILVGAIGVSAGILLGKSDSDREGVASAKTETAAGDVNQPNQFAEAPVIKPAPTAAGQVAVPDPQTGLVKIPAGYPTTPEGTVERFYSLLIKSDYNNAFAMLYPKGEKSAEFGNPAGLKLSVEKYGLNQISRVEITGRGSPSQFSGSRTPVFGIIYWKDGTKTVFSERNPLIYVEQENSVWYIE